MNKKFSLETIDIIFIIILLTISTIIKIQTYPDGIAIDEANHWAEVRHHKILEVYTGNYNSPMPESPLFFYINYLMIRIKNDLLIFRIPQILFSYATIILFYIFAKTFFNRYTAFLASFLLTISRSFNLVSAYVNPHIYQMFFSLATIITYMLAVKEKNEKYLIWTFIFAAICYLINPLGVITITTLIFSLLLVKNKFIYVSKNKSSKKLVVSKNLIFGLLIFFLITIVISPGQFLKGRFIKDTLLRRSFIQEEKRNMNIPSFSFSLLITLWNVNVGFTKVFIIIGAIGAIIISFKKKILLPLLIYLLTYLFVMSFAKGAVTYTVHIIMFLYIFFSEIAFKIINIFFIFVHKAFSNKLSLIQKKERINTYLRILGLIVIPILLLFLYESEKKYYKCNMQTSLGHEQSKKVYEYIKSKNESGVYILLDVIASSINYYVSRDKVDIHVFGINHLSNFSLEMINEALPPEHYYYDYIVLEDYDYLNKNSSRYTTFQKIEETCILETKITRSSCFADIRRMSIFNCKNMTLTSKS